MRALEPQAGHDYAPRIGRILLILAAAAVLLVAAGDGLAARAAARDDRATAARAAVVDLRSAISQEYYAIHAIDSDSIHNAAAAITNSERALSAVSEMADTMLADDLPGLPDTGWKKVKHYTDSADSYYDQEALYHLHHDMKPEDAARWIRGAITKKNAALKVVNYLAHPPCTELVNLRGPIMVNGVPQGPSQLTLSFSCTVAINEVEVDIPNAAIQSCDGSGDACAVNGDLVTLHAGDSKTATMTLDTENVGDGDHFASDIVPIAGDTVVVDEIM